MITSSQGPTVRPAEVKPQMQHIRQEPSKFPSMFSKDLLHRKGFDGYCREQMCWSKGKDKRERGGPDTIKARSTSEPAAAMLWQQWYPVPFSSVELTCCQQHLQYTHHKPISLQRLRDHRFRFKNMKHEPWEQAQRIPVKTHSLTFQTGTSEGFLLQRHLFFFWSGFALVRLVCDTRITLESSSFYSIDTRLKKPNKISEHPTGIQ